MRVPIVRPSLADAEIEAVTRVLRSGWVTQGPEVAAFEREFAAAVGAEHAVAVANCTVALELALRVVGVRAGDDVATVSHSFVATANAVIAVGARPVFVDVERDTFGMDPEALERALTPRTRAVLCVHQIGMPCDLEGLLEVCRQRGLPLIEDAACAIGSEIEIADRWERIGRPHGVIACFSMHPRKVVTTGDGGMICTGDATLASRLKLLRQHAMNVPDTVRHHSQTVVYEEFLEPAYNYRLTDLQAAVGRPQLARLDAIVRERRALAARYIESLADTATFSVPHERATARSNWQSFPLFIRTGARLDQRAILQRLFDAGIAAKRGIVNAHQEPAYADRTRWACGAEPCGGCARGRCERLAVSESLRDGTILVPLFHGMTEAEQGLVIDACRACDGA